MKEFLTLLLVGIISFVILGLTIFIINFVKKKMNVLQKHINKNYLNSILNKVDFIIEKNINYINTIEINIINQNNKKDIIKKILNNTKNTLTVEMERAILSVSNNINDFLLNKIESQIH